MYNKNRTYPSPYYVNKPNTYHDYSTYPYPYSSMYNADYSNQFANQYNPYTDKVESNSNFNYSQLENDVAIELQDYGPEPFVVNIDEATKQNNTFRTALWTGSHLQVTLMSIDVGEDIGLEVHPNLDQFIRIEEGQGVVQMGDREDRLNFEEEVYDDFAFIIPAGKYHNLVNTGDIPLKLYSIYAPPEHPRGTVHETKAIAEAAEGNHRH